MFLSVLTRWTIVVSLFFLPHPFVFAETTKTLLPKDFTDFAIDPESGMLAAVSAESNEVTVFDLSSPGNGLASVVATIPVGRIPCSIVYKEYQDLRLFAVVCLDDPSMYLIDVRPNSTGKKEFPVLQTVSLFQRENTLVATSLNREDPFLYFGYLSNRGRQIGAVNLREMQHYSATENNATDFAVSANGQTLFLRKGQYERAVLSLNRSMTDSSPSFFPRIQTRAPTQRFFPDPFDRLTAMGGAIFTSGLEIKESTLDFTPQCFLQTKPIVAGVFDLAPTKVGAPVTTNRSLEVRVASSNSFKNAGIAQAIQYENPDDKRFLTFSGGRSNDDAVEKRFRMIADEKRSQLVIAEGKTVHRIPLNDFKFADEPFVAAKIQGIDHVFSQHVAKLEIIPSDPRIEITVDQVPEGMEINGKTLLWRPNDSQVGSALVRLTLKYAGIRRKQLFRIPVEYPNLSLPFSPGSFVIDSEANEAFLCEAGPVQGVPVPEVWKARKRIASIDLKTMKILREQELPDCVGAIAATAKHIIYLPAIMQTNRCEVLSRSDLRRVTSLVLVHPISHLAIVGKFIVLQSKQETIIFDSHTVQETHRFENEPKFGNFREDQSVVSSHGIFGNGVMYGFDMKPKLLFQPTGLVGSDKLSMINTVPLMPSFPSYPRYLNTFHQTIGRDPFRTRKATIPNSDVQIQLEHEMLENQSDNGHALLNLVLTTTGAINEKKVILTGATVPSYEVAIRSPTLFRVAQKYAIVIYQRRMYRWDFPSIEAKMDAESQPLLTAVEFTGEFEEQPNVEATLRPSFVPLQTSVTLAKGATTELKHAVLGGTQPLVYSIDKGFGGMQVNAQTGTVVLDNVNMQAAAMNMLVSKFQAEQDKVQAYLEYSNVLATQLLGRAPNGLLVGIPIKISVSDSGNAVANFQYCVIAEVPKDSLMQKLDEAMKKSKSDMKSRDERFAKDQAEKEFAEKKLAELLPTLATTKPRVWKNKGNTIFTTAYFVCANSKTAWLKPDGQNLVRVSLESICDADRDYVKLMLNAPVKDVVAAKPRKWASKDGNFQMEAILVDFIDGKVQLQRVDNKKIVSVKLELLCDADQEVVRKLPTK